MKNKLLHLLVTIGVGFIASQSKAQEASPLYVIDRSTGRLIATDVWNHRNTRDSRDGREHDKMVKDVGPLHNKLCFILGNILELETNGTSVKASMIIGLYTAAGYNDPNQLVAFLYADASDYDGSLGIAHYGVSTTGDLPDRFGHYEEHKSLSQVTVEALSRETTKAGELLWILKVDYTVELQKAVDYLPYMDIYCQFQTSQLRFSFRGGQRKAMASDLRRQLQKSIVPTPDFTKANKFNTPVAPITQSPNVTTTTTELPEIRLSITKQDGFLLITFSPIVAGANLEQANINSYPWAWQAAVTATNSATNGWYVIPNLEPRVFRVRIDR